MTAPAALDPTVAAELGALVDGVWDGRLDPALIEHCRRRMCALLGADPATARHPASPSEPGAADARVDACVEFAEQWVLDPHAVSDEQAARVRAHLDDAGCAAFTIALALLEAQIRTELTLDALR